MSEKNILGVAKREESGRKMRQVCGKRVPAVIYGQEASQMLWVDTTEFNRVFSVAGESQIIELSQDKKEAVSVIIRDIQRDPLTSKVKHIDFYRVAMKEEIEADIPVNLIGKSAAVKEYGGIVINNTDSITVRCLPGDLPEGIDVDLSTLEKLNDSISVGSITPPDKVVFVTGKDISIVSVMPPRVEEVEEEQEESTEESEDSESDGNETEEKSDKKE